MKQLLSIILLLAAIMPDSILAMEKPTPSAPPLYPIIISSSSSHESYPEYPAPLLEEPLQEINPVHISRFSNPLKPETIAYVENCSKGSALIGALLGGCGTGSYIQRYGNNLSLNETIGLTGAVSAFSGLVSYVTAKWIVTSRTDEKRDEATINEIIDLNNAAFASKCTLDTGEREHLNILMDRNQSAPENRVMVYDYPLTLHPFKGAREYPVKDAVFNLDGIADGIQREGEAVRKMKTERPPSDNHTISDKNWDKILKDVKQTHQAMSRLNGILSAYNIRDWTKGVKKLPEYTYQNLQDDLRKKQKDLKDREAEIRYNLAYLAWLHKDGWAEFHVASIESFLANKMLFYHPNTPAGRQARQEDITATGKNISKSVKDYLIVCNGYADIVINHNKQVHKIPDTIKDFVESRRNTDSPYGSTEELESHEIDDAALAWDDHINLNDSRYFKTWFEQNFSNRPH